MKGLPTIFFICITSIVWSQNVVEPSLLYSVDNWKKEIISFPIEWAPNLNLKGFEELRFAPYWSDPESEDFWTLVMAWKVDAHDRLTMEEIENNFEAYFDGLMKPNHWATTFPRPTALFISNPNKNGTHAFIGKMKLFDGFYTGKSVTLNIKAQQYFSKKTNKAIVILRISPNGFEHSIWEKLNNITHKPLPCEY